MTGEKLYQFNCFGNLKVRKYKREVFYDNLWHTDPILLESRGHVLDENDKMVARPFKKLFNYLENDTNLSLDKDVVAVEKVNGFMFHVTMNYETEEFIQGTTGSLNSAFTDLAKSNMEIHNINYDAIKELTYLYGEPMTFIFEIKDNERDPHIIHDEADGVYLLGVRYVESGDLVAQYKLDEHAELINAKRPKWEIKKFADVLREVNTIYHEGYVLYCPTSHDGLLKIKSPFYITKKSLMRKHSSFVYDPSYKTLVDEEYYPIIEKVVSLYSESRWSILNEQKRGHIFNTIYKSSILSTEKMMIFITNHPKLSYRMNDDVIKVHYCEDGNYFNLSVDSYVIQTPEMNLIKYKKFVSINSSFDEAVRDLYINIISSLGNYEYLEDGLNGKRANIVYMEELKQKIDSEIDTLNDDIEYYSELK